MKEQTVQDKVANFLDNKTDYEVVSKKSGSRLGCSIVARSGRARFLIECKGVYSANNNESVFIESLGRIITRMQHGDKAGRSYGIALPRAAAQLAMRKIPWRVARQLDLCVFSVTPAGRVKMRGWKELKKQQA